MKHSRFGSILILVFLFLAAGDARASTVIVIETTAPRPFLPSLLVDARELGGALPDGERLVVYRLGQGWQPAFDDVLSASSRIALGQILNSTYAVRGRPDWATALLTATTVARSSDPARVFLFASGLTAATRSGPYRGAPLSELLKDEQLAPGDVAYFVRFLGESSGGVERTNVRLISGAANWPEILRVPDAVAPASPVPPEEVPPPARSLYVALVITVATTIVALLLFRQYRRAKERRALSLMAKAASPPTSDEAESTREEIVHLIARAGRTDASPVTIGEGDRVLIGDHFKARPIFTADGCYVALNQRAGILRVANPSNRAARIGSFELTPGRSRTVPLAYFEMLVGNEKLVITRQARHARAQGEALTEEVITDESL